MPNAINISKSLKAILDEYGEEIRGELSLAVADTTKATLTELKSLSPVKTGSYRKGWRSKIEQTRWGTVNASIYNETDWQLTHLLNDGHDYVDRNGQRIEDYVKGDGHIDKAGEFADSQLMVEVEKRLEQ